VDLLAHDIGDLARPIGARLTDRQRYGCIHAVKLSAPPGTPGPAGAPPEPPGHIAPLPTRDHQQKSRIVQALRHPPRDRRFLIPVSQTAGEALTVSAAYTQPGTAWDGIVSTNLVFAESWV
jgi:hypothetical protein